jgi:hypothetical protein
MVRMMPGIMRNVTMSETKNPATIASIIDVTVFLDILYTRGI